ncbi:MAG: hypothetical protein IPH16_14465 [Haliscomenobacter sp.]|nr:hypothetical protein [Haliscomenobacter sp.]
MASTYDYADFLITATRTHQPGAAAGTGNQTIKTEYWNDHTGRKTGLLLELNGPASRTHLAEYNYDFRERLIERNLHAGLYGSTGAGSKAWTTPTTIRTGSRPSTPKTPPAPVWR